MDLHRRAKVYAALGDPVRLGLVDRLVLSDLTPTQLAKVAGIGSNLIAHHLRVLESAGLIDRHPSEGDGRRSYVRLRLEEPAVRALVLDAGRPSKGATPRVVFVCTHNSARSKLAAADWGTASDIPATSAGTHPAQRVHPRAEAAARKHQLRLTSTTSSFDEVVRPGDLVVSVCDQAHEELSTSAHPPALHWSVPDPVPSNTDAAFERAFTEITSRVRTLAGVLAERS